MHSSGKGIPVYCDMYPVSGGWREGISICLYVYIIPSYSSVCMHSTEVLLIVIVRYVLLGGNSEYHKQ